MTVVRTEDLTKTYGDVAALSGLSLSVEAGELFGLLGPNGAGKTTTIEILTGQLDPSGGTASVLDTDPTTDPIDVRRQVGILPEQEAPPSFMTPREYFGFVGDVRDIDDAVLESRIEEWTGRLGFRDKLDTLAADLSRGQQQKVMITQAFLHEPRVVFIDEPLANLDPIVQERAKEFFESYVREDNSLLLSTHHIEVAEEICTRVAVVSEGEIVQRRRPSDLGDGESLLDTFLAGVEGEEAVAGAD